MTAEMSEAVTTSEVQITGLLEFFRLCRQSCRQSKHPDNKKALLRELFEPNMVAAPVGLEPTTR